MKIKNHRSLKNRFNPSGFFDVEIRRLGKLIKKLTAKNDVVNVGKNYILDVMFNGGTQIANNSWYIGQISNSGYSALAAADTMSSHAGWTEFTNYSQSNRVAWGSGSASSQSVTNATPATFDITATGVLKGLFVVSNNTKGGTTGTLWATALYSADVNVVNGDQVKVTYTLNC